jgi:hypothetical protein
MICTAKSTAEASVTGAWSEPRLHNSRGEVAGLHPGAYKRGGKCKSREDAWKIKTGS